MALPVRTEPVDRRAAVLRLLAASPQGLSDAALARALGGPEAGVRPQTINHLCRRMAADGEIERVGRRPILNRLPGRGRRRTKAATVEAVPSLPASEAPDAGAGGEPDVEVDAPVPEASAAPEPTPYAPRSPNPRPTLRFPKHPPPKAIATVARRPEGAACTPPPYDALQAWSRVVNVQALVAGWLVRRGATLRSATLDGHGPARDLVASLDGDDVHVEVTGWPADGARTHPTTIAGDWFAAAEQAATARRRAHPRARIVIALPDTRRYRSLAEQRAASLAGAGTEVWFVDPAGVVDPR